MRAVLGACLLLCSSGLLLLSACDRDAKVAHPPEAPPRAQVSIGVHVIDAEIADTPERQRRGLSGRRSLARGEGRYPYDA